MRRTTLRCFYLLLLSAAILAAETPLVPRGPAARVDSAAASAGNGEAPVPALAPDGGVLVVWATPVIFSSAILVRRFDADGKPGPAETMLDAGLGPQSPRIISFAPDRFLTVWSNVFPFPGGVPAATGAPGTLSALLLDGKGAPLGAETQVDTAGAGAAEPQLAALPGGGAVAIWESNGLRGRLFNAAGQPAGAELNIATAQCGPRTAALSGIPAGFLALWWTSSTGADCTGIQGVPFQADGKPYDNFIHIPYAPVVAVGPNGFLTLTTAETGSGRELRSTFYSAAGYALSLRTLATAEAGPPVPVAVGVDEAGSFLALWSTTAPSTGTVLHARLLDLNGIPAGDPFVAGSRADSLPLPARATGRSGEWAVTWTGQPVAANGPEPLYVRRFGPCTGLCLNGGRFTATVDWTNPRDGSTGSGHALPLTGETGSFWFFDPRNVELDVKVLDGRAVNGHFWVFYAALSDVEFTLKVTDQETGVEKTYHNKPYTLASQADVTAF